MVKILVKLIVFPQKANKTMNTLIEFSVVLLIASHYNLYKARDTGIRGRLILIHFLSIITHSNMKYELIFICLIIHVFILAKLFSFNWFSRLYSLVQMSQNLLRHGEFLISLSVILLKYLLGGPNFTLFIRSYFIFDDG